MFEQPDEELQESSYVKVGQNYAKNRRRCHRIRRGLWWWMRFCYLCNQPLERHNKSITVHRMDGIHHHLHFLRIEAPRCHSWYSTRVKVKILSKTNGSSFRLGDWEPSWRHDEEKRHQEMNVMSGWWPHEIHLISQGRRHAVGLTEIPCRNTKVQ